MRKRRCLMNKSFKAHFQLSTSFFSFPGGKSLSLSLPPFSSSLFPTSAERGSPLPGLSGCASIENMRRRAERKAGRRGEGNFSSSFRPSGEREEESFDGLSTVHGRMKRGGKRKGERSFVCVSLPLSSFFCRVLFAPS